MADLAALLQASLVPATRKQAEVSLKQISVQPEFLPHLLQLVLDHFKELSVRLAGSIYLKNIAKLSWDEVRSPVLFLSTYLTLRQQDVQPLPAQDKALLRSQLVPAMIALSGASDKAIRTQIAQAISLIAELDFPSQWGDLIAVRAHSITPPFFFFCPI
jgi:exportin-2 (importin alpha re-exporter)